MNRLKSRAVNCEPFRNDPRFLVGAFLQGFLHHNLDIQFRLSFAEIVVNDIAAITVQDTGEEVKRAIDIDIRHIDMPVPVGRVRLDDPRAFL